MTKFNYKYYGKDKSLHIGQHVQVTYYNESIQLEEDKRWLPFTHRIFGDTPFTPVKLGVIVGSVGIQPYYLSGSTNTGDGKRYHGTEQYLYVKFKEYFFNKAIPMSCISDAEEAANNMLKMLERHECRLGDFGFSLDAYTQLKKQSEKALKFAER